MGTVSACPIATAEAKLKKYLKCYDVVLTSSGLAALEISLIVSGLKPRDIVACDALYPFAAMATLAVGAQPIAFDLEPATQEPSIESLVRCVEAGATFVILTSYFGRRAATPEIVNCATSSGLTVVEDRAQNFAQHSENFIATLSFQTGKFINCGFGGAIVVSSKFSAHLARQQVNLGWWPRQLDDGSSWSSGWKTRVPGRSLRLQPKAADMLIKSINSIPEKITSLEIFLRQLRVSLKSVVGHNVTVPNAKGVRLVSTIIGVPSDKQEIYSKLSALAIDYGVPSHPPVTEWPKFKNLWNQNNVDLKGTRELLSSLILISLDTWTHDQ